ncbi:MAG: GYF domain-containing protein [Chthoniobacter sp.]|nr:GYF domain-containing protein [Chthoniobacter sp.]
MNWYYDLGGQRQGPVPEAELDRLLAAGTINVNTLVWSEGMANWTPLREARPTGSAAPATTPAAVPEGWVRCTATGRYFPPSQIVYLDGKAYSAEAKAGIVQGVIQGGELPDNDESLRTGPAWEQRAQLGFSKAIWETIKAVLMDPSRTFETMKRAGGIGTPLGFFFVAVVVCVVFSALYGVLFQGVILSIAPAETRQQMAVMAGAGAFFHLIRSVFLAVLLVVISFIGSGILHLVLMMLSGARQKFETSYRTFCYTMGAGLSLSVIPMCGVLIGLIWGLVGLCIGLAKTQGIETGRSVGAVLISVVVGCLVCCTLYMLLVGVIIAGVAGMSGGFK